MKRIVYLAHRFPEAAEPYATAEVAGLIERGIELEIRVLRQQYREADDPLPPDLPVRSTPLGVFAGLRFSRHPAQRLRTATAGTSLARRIDQARDHIHAPSSLELASVGLFASRKSRATFSFGVHTFQDTDLMPEKVARARFVAAGSEFGRETILRRFGEEHRAKVHVVRRGVPSRPSRTSFTPGTVVTAGKAIAAKGHDILIRAIGALRENGSDAMLEIIGDGPDRPALQGIVDALRLDDRVSFAGALPLEETLARIGRSEVFALTCRESRTGDHDDLPLALMDAMSLGVPCVSSNAFGIPELIEDGASGILAPAADADAVAEGLSLVLGNAEAQESLGAAGRGVVQDRYDLDRSLDALAKLLREHVE